MDYSSWTVPAQTISYLEADLMIVISVVFVLAFVAVVRYSAKILQAAAGMVAFLFFGVLGAEAVCGVVLSLPGVNQLAAGSVIFYCVIRAIVISVMYHLARCFAIRLASQDEYTIGNCMMAGVGSSVVYCVVSGFNYMYMSALAETINDMGVPAMLEGCTEAEATQVIASVTGLTQGDSLMYLMLGIGAAIDIVFMVLVCVFAYGVFSEKLDKRYHVVQIVAGTLIVLPTVILESYSTEMYIMLTLVKAGMLVLIFFVMLHVDKMFLGDAFTNTDGRGYKTVSKLPRMKKK